MVRSRRTKIAAEEKTRLVLAVLAGEMTCAEAARRCGVASTQVTKWKHQFLEAGAQRLQEVPSGAAHGAGSPEQRRLRMENEQLKLALAEATVQLRIWQRGAALADQVLPGPRNPKRSSRSAGFEVRAIGRHRRADLSPPAGPTARW
ncbi:hypothetical protein MGALJ_22300 [Mycobacterium gallinarum]|uniref:Insertion element IS150 protein InsJ-like helix-turn-helix domain-containing protein n=1 Tax=Mycobacterium gallinarum TaxID=39689 RepID=A0A9W4FF16_9MYCO|nr:hypothetical protein MGALJ_22300 [Mycobacterium gallinarum]